VTLDGVGSALAPAGPPADWWAAVQQPARKPRWPLWLGADRVGSVEPEVWAACARHHHRASAAQPWSVQQVQRGGQTGLVLGPDGTASFDQLARTLRDVGCCGPWRDEALPVRDGCGAVRAQVERGAARVLGVTTQAVHLVGRRADGAVWVQQRAWTKANDPGLWDTLMGGTVAAGESVADTLCRETWEEAGLVLSDLGDLTRGGQFLATRPVPDGGSSGQLVEDTHWYTAQVPDHLLPRNQDGEVDHFEAWTPQAVARACAQGRFTPEARWVLFQCLAPAFAQELGWA
jgi:8-oxo-dGTP pyrophosphatase MutT (NUDIX family)